MASMKIDVEKLIRLVEVRPVIWDKTVEHYRSSQHTRLAWHEIFTEMLDGYRMMDDRLKSECEKAVKTKWTQTRDVWQKGLKKRREMEAPRGSMESVRNERMKFLLKVYNREEHMQVESGDSAERRTGRSGSVDSEAETVINLMRTSLNQQQDQQKHTVTLTRKTNESDVLSQADLGRIKKRPKIIQGDGDNEGVLNVYDDVLSALHKPGLLREASKMKLTNCKEQPTSSRTLNIEPVYVIDVDEEPSSGCVDDDLGSCSNSGNTELKSPFSSKFTEEVQIPTSSNQSNAEVKDMFNAKNESDGSSESKYAERKRPREEGWKNDELETFFKSLLPRIQNFNEEQVLDFQQGIFQLIKRIKFPIKES